MRTIEKKASLKPQYPYINIAGGLHNKNVLSQILSQNLRNVTKKFKSMVVIHRDTLKAMLVYIAGLISGIVITMGFIVFLQRNGFPGGEALIIPMIILLLAFGWDTGKGYGHSKGHSKGFNEGFEEGYYEAIGLAPHSPWSKGHSEKQIAKKGGQKSWNKRLK